MLATMLGQIALVVQEGFLELLWVGPGSALEMVPTVAWFLGVGRERLPVAQFICGDWLLATVTFRPPRPGPFDHGPFFG